MAYPRIYYRRLLINAGYCHSARRGDAMEWAPYRMLIIDATAHALLLIDGGKGEIVAEMSYPELYIPTGLSLTQNTGKAYLPAAGNNGSGSLFIANLENFSLYRLPFDIPHPLQFTITPNGNTAYVVDPGGTLYSLDTVLMTATPLGRPDNATCVGITADHSNLYTAWENPEGGCIAIFEHGGQFIKEYQVAGIPTNITVHNGRIIVPFTAASFTGEGIAIIDKNKTDDSIPVVITIQDPLHTNGLTAYPCSVTVAPDERTAYVINEDSGSITIIDLETAATTGHIAIGRSISALHILPDSRFGIASSNMFADLSLIDLVNKRLLSVTASCHEILSHIAVIPE